MNTQVVSPGPPVRPARRRGGWLKVGLIIAGAVVVVIVLITVIAVAAGGGKTSNSGSPTVASTSTSPGPSTPGIGTPVRDGKFQFTVTRISHAHTVGDQYLNKTAQGEYTILHVTVQNISGVAQTLDDSAQYVYDAHGRKFLADTEADIYVNGNDNVFLNSVNPGNSVKGKIAFDLPPGDQAVKAELHDSVFSDGVTVSLR